jgi:hypothetical protein
MNNGRKVLPLEAHGTVFVEDIYVDVSIIQELISEKQGAKLWTELKVTSQGL